MDDLFIVVVVVVSLAALAGAAVILATSRGPYDHIGRGGIEARPETAAEREADLQELLAARAARRAARGAPADDVAALTAAADPELAAEVRRHVEARNARRVARGQPPLDVEAEVSRRLRSL